MEVEVVVATALTMKKAVVFLHMMLKLGFDESFGSVPLYIDNTSALHIAGNPTYSARAKQPTPDLINLINESVRLKTPTSSSSSSERPPFSCAKKLIPHFA